MFSFTIETYLPPQVAHEKWSRNPSKTNELWKKLKTVPTSLITPRDTDSRTPTLAHPRPWIVKALVFKSLIDDGVIFAYNLHIYPSVHSVHSRLCVIPDVM